MIVSSKPSKEFKMAYKNTFVLKSLKSVFDGLEYNDVWVPNGDRDWIYDAATRTWTLVGVLNTTNPFASFIVYFNVTKNGTLYNNVTAKSNLTNETNATNKTRSYLPNMTLTCLI